MYAGTFNSQGFVGIPQKITINRKEYKMDKRIIVNWERYQQDEKFFLLVEAFLFCGWQPVFVEGRQS